MIQISVMLHNLGELLHFVKTGPWCSEVLFCAVLSLERQLYGAAQVISQGCPNIPHSMSAHCLFFSACSFLGINPPGFLQLEHRGKDTQVGCGALLRVLGVPFILPKSRLGFTLRLMKGGRVEGSGM